MRYFPARASVVVLLALAVLLVVRPAAAEQTLLNVSTIRPANSMPR